MTPRPQTPAERRDFLIHYARVLLREARARRDTPFAATLLEWAANRRREAAEIRPAQGSLAL